MAGKLGKSGSLISRWSAQNDWRVRVVAWDDDQARVRDAEYAAASKKRARRQAEITQATLEAAALPVGEMLRRVQREPATLAALPIGELLKVMVAAGRLVPNLVQTQRLIDGHVTERIENQGPADSDALSLRELDTYLAGVDRGRAIGDGDGG